MKLSICRKLSPRSLSLGNINKGGQKSSSVIGSSGRKSSSRVLSVHSNSNINAVLSRFHSSVSGNDVDASISMKPEDASSFNMYKSPFMAEMQARGYIHQCSDFQDLDECFSKNETKSSSSTVMKSPIACYLGFDATASSLHVGSLLQIMVLRLLQRHGHKPYVLIGGGTTKVGDPSGKDEARMMLSNETIQRNVQNLSKVFSNYIKFGDGANDAVMVNNSNWLESLNYLDFLRDFGVHFSVNRMLTFESVKARLAREQPLSFLEFNYMLLQAYDFYELFNRYNISVQIGGSDQWGNIIGGVDLIRRVKKHQAYALTTPLITTSDGRKMGKSVSGAVWLDKTLLSEFDYWQFWRNCTDADLPRFLRLYTDLPMSKIREMDSWKDGDLNQAKIILADEATRLLHGELCLESIHATTKSLFAANSTGSSNAADLSTSCLPKYVLDMETSQKLSSSASLTGSNDEVNSQNHNNNNNNNNNDNNGVAILDIMIRSNMAPTRNEGRRMIAAGSVRINDVKVDQEFFHVTMKHFNGEKFIKLSSSKKKHMLIYLS